MFVCGWFFCIFTQLSIDFGMCRYYNISYIFIPVHSYHSWVSFHYSTGVSLARLTLSSPNTTHVSPYSFFNPCNHFFFFFLILRYVMRTAASRGLCCGPNTFSRVFQLLRAVKCGRMYIWGLQRRCGSIRGGSGSINDSSLLGFGPLQDCSPPAPPLLLLLLLSHISSFYISLPCTTGAPLVLRW